MRPLPLIIGIVAAIIITFFFLSRAPSEPSERSLNDATANDRCAEFQQVVDPETGESYVLGYGGRIRQLLSGCL